jgi:hypothetical protein
LLDWSSKAGGSKAKECDKKGFGKQHILYDLNERMT